MVEGLKASGKILLLGEDATHISNGFIIAGLLIEFRWVEDFLKKEKFTAIAIACYSFDGERLETSTAEPTA